MAADEGPGLAMKGFFQVHFEPLHAAKVGLGDDGIGCHFRSSMRATMSAVSAAIAAKLNLYRRSSRARRASLRSAFVATWATLLLKGEDRDDESAVAQLDADHPLDQ